MKEEDNAETILAGSRAAKPKAGPEVEMLESAMEKYCLIGDTSSSYFEDEYEFATGSVFTENVNLILAHPLYITRRARGRFSFVHNAV